MLALALALACTVAWISLKGLVFRQCDGTESKSVYLFLSLFRRTFGFVWFDNVAKPVLTLPLICAYRNRTHLLCVPYNTFKRSTAQRSLQRECVFIFYYYCKSISFVSCSFIHLIHIYIGRFHFHFQTKCLMRHSHNRVINR